MIKVNVYKSDSYINKVVVSGHALYDKYGKDIVCAACSSIVTTSINSLIALDKKYIEYTYIDEILTINVISKERVVQVLVNEMVSLLKELEGDYPKNINVLIK